MLASRLLVTDRCSDEKEASVYLEFLPFVSSLFLKFRHPWARYIFVCYISQNDNTLRTPQVYKSFIESYMDDATWEILDTISIG